MNKLYLISISLLLSLSTAEAGIHSGVGQTFSIDCNRSPVSSIQGTSNTVRVTGSCQSLTVAGADNQITAQATKQLSASGASNQITVQQVDSIAVQGADTTVRYHAGLTVKNPKISISGADSNAVRF